MGFPSSSRAAAVLCLAAVSPAFAGGLPDGFVYLSQSAPGIRQDMRYATARNFTGKPVPGYLAGECVLRREAAEALARVEADLAAGNFALKVYDCYRPVRAVTAFVAWAGAPETGETKHHYPNLRKSALFGLGYIAARSAHSTGLAVDLTLAPLPLPAASAPAAQPHSAAPCIAQAGAREANESADMGTAFDCFDDKSHTASANINASQRAARRTLMAAMERHGFKNYSREWWHFSFGGGGTPFDFPVTAPAAE